jgi:ParB-like nuclease family protein
MNDLQIAAEYSFIKSATPPKYIDFPTAKIVVDRVRNGRDEELDVSVYDIKNASMAALVASMKVEGFLITQPVVLHQNSMEMHGNRNVEVLIGHRRVTAAGYAGLATVPAIMISGLTEDKKLALLMDPVREPIKDIGNFKLVRKFKGKMGMKKLAEKLGITKNRAQELSYVDDLPTDFQEMWKSYVRGVKTPFPCGRPTIMSLHAAMNRDHAGTTLNELGVESAPDVNQIDLNPLGGPEYHKAFAKLMSEGAPTQSNVNRKALINTGTSVKDTVVRNLIYGLAEHGNVDAGAALHKVVDISERFNNLLTLRNICKQLQVLINFPTTEDRKLDDLRQQELAEFISNAVLYYLNQFPSSDPTTYWLEDKHSVDDTQAELDSLSTEPVTTEPEAEPEAEPVAPEPVAPKRSKSKSKSH